MSNQKLSKETKEIVKATAPVLQEKGLKKNLRRSPGQITTESYW